MKKAPLKAPDLLYKNIWVKSRTSKSHGKSEWEWEWVCVPNKNWRKALRNKMEWKAQDMHSSRSFTFEWVVVKNPPLEVVEQHRDSAVRDIMYAEKHAKAMMLEYARVKNEQKAKRK